jgi:hypothetical protein
MSGIIGVGPDETNGIIDKHPKGQPIQTVTNVSNTEANGGSGAEFVSACQCDITISKTGSHVLILPNALLYLNTQNDFLTIKVMFKASGTRSGTVSDYTNIITHIRSAGGSGDNGNYWNTLNTLTDWTHGQTAGTVCNVALIAFASAGLCASNNAGADSRMTLQEIQYD